MISAILLCYNQKHYVGEQLRAILRQDYEGEWEIIISDDASQDGSFEYLQKLVAQEAQGRTVIMNRNPVNRGIAGNLQSAVNLSHGEWIVKFDGDDIAREDRLSTLVALIRDYPGYLMYFHDCNYIDKNGNFLDGKELSDSDEVQIESWHKRFFDISGMHGHFGGHAMYHRSLFTDFPDLPSGSDIADDTLLDLRAYLKKSGAVKSGKRCSYYRQHADNNVNIERGDPRKAMLRQCGVQLVTFAAQVNELCRLYRTDKLSWQKLDVLLRLFHAEQRRLLLYPEASYGNNPFVKGEWYVNILKCRPKLWLLSLPRLLPSFLVDQYLKHKGAVKKLLSSLKTKK